jgi:hypothetical protein
MGALAHWRSPEPYAALARCDRAMLAWEWLRRDPEYRRASEGCGAVVCDFGLIAFEDAGVAAPIARPMWRAGMDPAVLVASAAPGSAQHGFDWRRLGMLARLVPGADGAEHLLISDGWQALRIDIVAGTLRRGPVELHWQLAGLAVAPQLETLRRLVVVARHGRFGMLVAPTKARTRARKLATLLRVHDALADRASQRDLAETLFGLDPARWRIEAASYRARVQRLVHAARRTAALGPQAILRDGTLLAPLLG